ncbi:flagellar cap protein FliD N-terminal domain-containing protein [Bacillus subtilis]
MVTRITVLASGKDIEDIVLKIMQTETAPLNKQTTEKQNLKWQSEIYR